MNDFKCKFKESWDILERNIKGKCTNIILIIYTRSIKSLVTVLSHWFAYCLGDYCMMPEELCVFLNFIDYDDI